MNYHSVTKHKRALEIPNVGINETFLKTLEKQFSSLGGDKLADGKYCLCTKIIVLFYCNSCVHNVVSVFHQLISRKTFISYRMHNGFNTMSRICKIMYVLTYVIFPQNLYVIITTLVRNELS